MLLEAYQAKGKPAMNSRFQFVMLATLLSLSQFAFGEKFSFSRSQDRLELRYGNQLVTTYTYGDKRILRPYFSGLREPGGVQLTRNHPPQKGDSDDHATMHPGLWLAFGDISGSDFWRNRGRVQHVKFTRQPQVSSGKASFAVENKFVAADGKVLCRQDSEFEWRSTGDGFFLDWKIRFGANKRRGFFFGDQEEMGLGVRVATQLTEDRGGGTIRNGDGKVGAKSTWGQAAKWCDYSAVKNKRRLGVAIFAAPSNSRVTWWHNRGYGLMVANAFGRKAMRQGPASKLEIPAAGEFTMRYGVLVYGSEEDNFSKLKKLAAEFGK